MGGCGINQREIIHKFHFHFSPERMTSNLCELKLMDLSLWCLRQKPVLSMCIDPAGMINQERMLYMWKKDVTNKAKIKPTYEKKNIYI